MRSSRIRRGLAAGFVVWASGLAAAGAPPGQGIAEPELSPAVRTLLAQDYLTPDERRALRVRHGAWEASDLEDPIARATAALSRGAWTDASLMDERTPRLDRAEGALRRGDPTGALSLCEGEKGARANRLRGESLLELGKVKEAIDALEAAASDKGGDGGGGVADVVEPVLARILLSRVRESKADEYRSMMSELSRVREQVGKLAWEPRLAEAALLYEKDNYPEAAMSLTEAMTLNPRLVGGWALAGQLAVDGFDMDKAEAIATKLDELASPAHSPEGAIIRARARLRQSDGEGALGALAPALECFPEHRGLLAARAAATAATFDEKGSLAQLNALDALAPGTPIGYMEAGRAMASARQYEQAADLLRVATERASAWAEPWIELGLSELQAGRLESARTALEKAASLDSFNVRAANSLTLLRELDTYATIQTPHFIVRYKPGIDEVMAREMGPVLEGIYERVTGSGPGGIDHEPAGRTVVELYPNHRWFSVRITGMPRLHTIAAATGPVIAMEPPREGPGHKAGAYDWSRVVQHEFTHTVTLSRTRNRLPHWFTEAGAVYLEDSPKDYSAIRLVAQAYENRTLLDFDTINVAFVRPARPTDRSLAYAQGHWMYEYIVERFGARAPLDLMDRYAAGEREEAAFRGVLGISRGEFLDDFRAHAGSLLGAWGMVPTDAHPSLRDLLSASAGETEEAPTTPTDAMIDRWLDQHPDNPFVLDAAVKRMLRATRNSPGPGDVPLLERYAAARPVDPLPHKLLASILLASRTPEEAIVHLNYLDEREQYSSAYATELARRYMALGDMTRAMAKALRASRIAPYDARVREFAATVAIRAGLLDDAHRHIEALIMLEPDVPIHAQRLEALRAMKNKD